MSAYYNEIDKSAAQWLRNLIAAGHIAPGEVDERSIEDVRPEDLRGFTQCHFFAGIGVWSYALRQAGWSDDRPVWTGSCPCQPFSAAGKSAGFDDERHLWPAFQHLIRECRPPVLIGEQVASKAVEPWIDLVQLDLEALGYAFGCVPFPSASVGAPHIRDRLYWVADADRNQSGPRIAGSPQSSGLQLRVDAGGCSSLIRLDNADDQRSQGYARHGGSTGWQRPDRSVAEAGVHGGMADAEQHDCGRQAEPADHVGEEADGPSDWAGLRGGAPCGLANSSRQRWERGQGPEAGGVDDGTDARRLQGDDGVTDSNEAGLQLRPAGPTNGFWRDADWLLCRDGKWRPVESGTFPLVARSASSVGRSSADWHLPAGTQGQGHRVTRLKGYGNAINAKAAQAFIEAYLGN